MDINVDKKGTPKTRVMLWFGIYLFNRIPIENLLFDKPIFAIWKIQKKMVYFGKQLKKTKYQSS